MPAWPAALNAQPEFRTLSISGQSGAIRTAMDTGPAKSRRRFGAVAKPVQLIFKPMTAAQIAAFEAFFEDTLAEGSLSFDMEHPVHGTTATFRFMDANPYRIAADGGDYSLTCRMEILP